MLLFEVPPEKLEYPMLTHKHQSLALEMIKAAPHLGEWREPLSPDNLEFLASFYCEPGKVHVLSSAVAENWCILYRRGDGKALLNRVKTFAEATLCDRVPYFPGGRPPLERSDALDEIVYFPSRVYSIPKNFSRELVLYGGTRGIYILVHLFLDPPHLGSFS